MAEDACEFRITGEVGRNSHLCLRVVSLDKDRVFQESKVLFHHVLVLVDGEQLFCRDRFGSF